MKKQTKKERIINTAVRNAVKGNNFGWITRRDAAEKAALAANKQGVNVQRAPYLQDIFYEALDEKESKGAFLQNDAAEFTTN